MSNMNNLTNDMIESAYLKLKHESYYDTVNLFLRYRIAEFEQSPAYGNVFERILALLDQPNNFAFGNDIDQLLNNINFNILPKSIKTTEEFELKKNNMDGNRRIITNVRSDDKYIIDDIIYFIDAPIELHIIDALWSMTVGSILDEKLGYHCLGNRILKNNTNNLSESGHLGLFKIYHHQYNKWRDDAIRIAEKSLEGKTDILIIAMDIKQCFYNIETDWDEILKITNVSNDYSYILCDIIKKMQIKFHEKIHRILKMSHPDSSEKIGLPIGLFSSAIINNWILSKLDDKIINHLNPLYYGRYVDDILIVQRSTSPINTVTDKDAVVKDMLAGIITPVENEDNKRSFRIHDSKINLEIQEEKLVIQHYNHMHSYAGLKKFRKEIEEKASEFRFLPEGDELIDLEECAYDVIYKGSVNKLRSVVGISENITEFSKYLSRRIIQNRLCQDPIKDEYLSQLFKFYRGKNIFEFCKLWEKVFTLLIVTGKESDCVRFFKTCHNIIDEISYENYSNTTENIIENPITFLLKKHLMIYLEISLSIPCGLKSKDYLPLKNKSIRKFPKEEIVKKSSKIRLSNMIRHQFVVYPLLNYTIYEGDLVDLEIIEKEEIAYKVNKDLIRKSPRFIHFDEYQLYYYFKQLIEHKYEEFSIFDILSSAQHDNLSYFEKYYEIKEKNEIAIKDNTEANKEVDEIKLCIGLANIKITDKDIERSHSPNKKPNLSIKRQSDLYSLLNDAVESPSCDLLIMPELSIPVAWLSFMAAFVRKHQIGLIFGLEHFIKDKKAHNIVVTILPFKMEGEHNGCLISMRLKNHYAPFEKYDLNRLHLTEITYQSPYYELFTWRGINFSVYNCYELSDISHRRIMKSVLDVMFAISWNKDVYYYSNIIESITRDLHCFVVYANTSQYGDSRIVAPISHEEMNAVCVKGGINTTVLKEKLNISDLRDFQIRLYSPDDKRYKPKPAGYNDEGAFSRIKYSKLMNNNYITIRKVKCD